MKTESSRPKLGRTDLDGGDIAKLAKISMPTKEHPESLSHEIIDASVQVRPESHTALRKFLPRLWRDRRLPPGERTYYPNIVGDYVREAYGENGPPGSEPELVEEHLFKQSQISVAILNPLTFGLLPDVDLLSAICSATNEWLAETWLSRSSSDRQYKGSIRVAPSDPQSAVREIEKWAEHPDFVQVSVPLQTLQPYGKRPYWPVWEAAEHYGLPIMVRAEAETGVELAPTPVGYMRSFWGFTSYQPMTCINHITNLMVEGVFDHLPGVKFIFGDGGFDLAATLMWRFDKDYLPMRVDMPWMKHYPSHYFKENTRFISRRFEGPSDATTQSEWLSMTEAETVLLYGSSYPAWDYLDARLAFDTADPVLRKKLLYDNAKSTYSKLEQTE